LASGRAGHRPCRSGGTSTRRGEELLRGARLEGHELAVRLASSRRSPASSSTKAPAPVNAPGPGLPGAWGFALQDDLAGVLVLAKAEEAGLAQPAVAGELGEADLGDQLGADPAVAVRTRPA
jgi:hypothetical protein